MPSQLIMTGFAELDAKLKALVGVDFTPVMEEWEKILKESNRQYRLQGLDGYGQPLAPLSALTIKYRRSAKGPADPKAPPFIPAWEKSRAIASFRTAHGRDGAAWYAVGAWEDVVSQSGVQFLPFHFRGEGRLPVRDLAHVPDDAAAAAAQVLADFAEGLISNG
jgi:hypothetical protein